VLAFRFERGDNLDKQLSKLKQLLSDLLIEPKSMSMLIESSCKPSRSGIRHFNQAEEDTLTADARGYLLELSRKGRIDQPQMELIIQFASMTMMKPVSKIMLTDVIDNLIFSFSDDENYEFNFQSSKQIN
jgi:uncharacterized protein Smg (DUF494 family)